MTLSQVNPIYYAISALREATLGVSDASFLAASTFSPIYYCNNTDGSCTYVNRKKIRF